MSVVSTVTVTVPGTTANLGPGFDCLGAALTLYNEFKFSRLGSDTPLEAERALRMTVTGKEAHRVTTDRSNLVYKAFAKLYQTLGHTPPPVQIDIKLGVPLARGLGSSATAIVGGLVGANQLAGGPLSQLELMQLAIDIEKHPDNVVPALVGGCRLAAANEGCSRTPTTETAIAKIEWEICDISWHPNLVPVVAIPDFELSTEKARSVLPQDYTRADAIFNTAHLGLLLRGLESGIGKWLQVGMSDRIHQPYRQVLIPGYQAVSAAALEAGAYGVAISGAGPTLLALAPASHSTPVAIAMEAAWQLEGIQAEAKALALDTQGAKINDKSFARESQ